MAQKLTLKEERFVAAYTGNGVEAARAAGYSGDNDTLAANASRLLTRDRVKAALAARSTKELRPLVKNRLERQQWWSHVMADEAAALRDRIRASELLGRSEADFTEKLEVKGELTLELLVLASGHKT